MIVNTSSIPDLQVEWDGVIQMRERMKSLVVVTFANGAITAPALAKVVYNLPLLLAFDVLKQALQQAKLDGRFSCPRDQLGVLMDHAKPTLPWIDWDRLREGVRRRNGVAHDGKLFDSHQCLQDIANVEAQLTAWGIINPD